MNSELQLYLSGRKDTGVLLCGQVGLPILEDAYFLASKILSTSKERIIFHPDFLFIEKGKEKSIGVGKVEDIFSKGSLKPSVSDKILILVDSLDSMTEQAQNKLLKLLEDSEHVLLIATAYSNTVLPTIKSRMRIIQYRPFTKDEFCEYCSKNNIKDSDMLFYATGGCPGTIAEYADAADIMKSVINSFMSKKPLGILESLHLVKEKDRGCFFTLYPQLVPNLYKLIGQLCSNAIVNGAPYQKEQLLTAISHVEKGLLACNSKNYTQNNFFLTMVSIIESLR